MEALREISKNDPNDDTRTAALKAADTFDDRDAWSSPGCLRMVAQGWLGVIITSINPETKESLNLKLTKGVLVINVTSGGPADKAGIKTDDVIVNFNAEDIKRMEDFPYIVALTPKGKKVPVEIIRQGEPTTVEVELGTYPQSNKHSTILDIQK